MTHADDVTLDLGHLSDGRRLTLPLEALNTHAQLLGPSGYGKSRLLIRLAQELITKTDDCVIALDPAGDLVNHLKDWIYGQGLEERLVLIDPRERRLVCGLNPVRPWGHSPGVQAEVIRDILRRSLGANETASSAPLASQWLYNVIFALIETRLTLFESAQLLDYVDGTLRAAVLERMGPSPARTDFTSLTRMLQGTRDAQALRLMNEQLGSTVRRLRLFSENDYLRHMLAGQANAIDWGWAIDTRKIVLVNLSLEDNALTEDDQRVLGQLISSSIIRNCFARPMGRRRPVNLLIDEAGTLASPEVATVLNAGRKFLLRLVLAHQTLSQLVNPVDQDRRLLDAVVNNAKLKLVFGGLGPDDASTMGATLFGHLSDPDKRKLELRAPIQLSHVEMRRSVTKGETQDVSRSRTRTLSEQDGEVWAAAHGVASGRSRYAGRNASSGEALSVPLDPNLVEGGVHIYSQVASAGEGEGDSDGETFVDLEGGMHSAGQADSRGVTRRKGRSRSVTEGPMVVPGQPIEILTSVQFESLEEQLHRHVSNMIRQPNRHAVVAHGKAQPVAFVVAEVPEPDYSPAQLNILDLRAMRLQPCFANPAEIDREIAERHRGLLQAHVVETVDVVSAIIARRATRARPAEDDDMTDDCLGAPVRVPPRPVRPRSRSSAKLVLEEVR